MFKVLNYIINYICKMNTVLGASMPPKFLRMPQNVTVAEGGSVSLQCACGGNPDPRVYWRKVGATVL